MSIFDDPAQYQVVRRVATLIESRGAVGEATVLGLPTGSTPIGVYQHLIRMHRKDGLDLSNVVTFNLDEYYPMAPDSLQSFHRCMRDNFFDHVNIPEENIHFPRGDLAPEEVDAYCLAYEHAIVKAGGLDLILLSVGRSGHIGFNELDSGPETRTRCIVLDEITRKDAASDFFGDEHVPREAITMGVGTILDAREILLMATGEHKAPIVRRAVEEEPNREVTATYLQLHRNAQFYVDRAAASDLTREKTPWLVRQVEWTPLMARHAVIWLSERLSKAILRLDADVRRYLSFIGLAQGAVGVGEAALSDFRAQWQRVLDFLSRKTPGQEDLEEIQRIKAAIRYAEAVAGIEAPDLSGEHARFLDLPFYQTGAVRKKPIGEGDVQIVLHLLRELRPQHLFVAGGLSDPHGTHRMCYVDIDRALRRYNAEGTEKSGDQEDMHPKVWLDRGAWQEWEIHNADIFMPMSRADLQRKIEAIFKHESQKDRAMFPGAYDEREFWQRARDRNTGTAAALNKLGLPEFYTAEAYVTTYEM